MKFIFNLLLLFCFSAKANVINIYHEKNLNKAKIVKKIFFTKYSIPENLILITESNCDNLVDKRFLNLCITKKGKLITLPSHISFLKKSLKAFQSP